MFTLQVLKTARRRRAYSFLSEVLSNSVKNYQPEFESAASVEGVKKQAPSLQDEIAAAAFKELTFNPADRMDSKSQESAHPNPVVDWIMRKLGATHDGERS